MVGSFPEGLNINRLFLKLNWFICNQFLVLPVHLGAGSDREFYLIHLAIAMNHKDCHFEGLLRKLAAKVIRGQSEDSLSLKKIKCGLLIVSMISESGMTEHLVQSYWCTCRPVYGCSFSITSLDIYHSIYRCLIKLSDHKRLTYQFRALIFSGCRNCKNMSHFQNLKLHIHKFRLQILKKKNYQRQS